MLDKLWEDIQFIYDELNFSNKLMINDLMIISQDNYFLLHYRHDDKPSIQIRIEKNYNLVNMWSNDDEVEIVNYKIYAEVGEQVYTRENSMIKLTYKIITPLIRHSKLNQIGV
jgi:hypothetical protein